jgi:hypothetical protein
MYYRDYTIYYIQDLDVYPYVNQNLGCMVVWMCRSMDKGTYLYFFVIIVIKNNNAYRKN